MKIFIETDLEGISGISKIEQITERDEYTLKRLMCDVNAAIRGFFDAGVDELFVRDSHGGGGNFTVGELDTRAKQIVDRDEIIDSCDGVCVIGAHAMAGTANAFLDHTQSSLAWHDYYINSRRLGEMGQLGAYAGAHGIPFIMMSGDLSACAEARSCFGCIETAVVKYADGRNRAKCISDDEAERLIYECAKRSVSLIGKIKPFQVAFPAKIEIEFNRSDYADDAMSYYSNLTRIDARRVMKWENDFNKYSNLKP